MVENGKRSRKIEMREWLPGGGVLEVVDYTLIFKSPMDGTKSAKSFRLDPTSYPKRIAILERDQTTGTGIYEFDQGKLVICVTNAASELPTEFSAPEGSNRTLMILKGSSPERVRSPGLNTHFQRGSPVHQPATTPQPLPRRPANSNRRRLSKSHSPPIVADTVQASF